MQNQDHNKNSILYHHKPESLSDLIALLLCKMLKLLADIFFQKRHGHRAVVLETIAGVPGMISGMMLHFKSLRQQCNDDGWIETFLNEAENERMHLMTFKEIARPNLLERLIIVFSQLSFAIIFLLLYIIAAKTAHRLVGYFEEEAIISYDLYLQDIDNGTIVNNPAPLIAINYWQLAKDAKLRDVIIAVQKDEAHHRNVNHQFADALSKINVKTSEQ